MSIILLVMIGTGSAGYVIYSKQKLRKLKERCASPGLSTSGTIFGKLEVSNKINLTFTPLI